MPERLRQQILFLCREVEEALANQEFSSCDESRVVEAIDEIKADLGEA